MDKRILFENDVKTYGTQTMLTSCSAEDGFENDVKTYGTQTFFSIERIMNGLRMM